jgi:ABC-type branched-subunit amino acid transport system ATPase component
LARTFQHPETFSGLTVREHLVLAHRVRHQKSRIWSDLFTLGSLRTAEPAESESVERLVELLGFGPVADQLAVGLPLGTARLLELGRALANSPSVLMLDEPSSGMDNSETEEFEQTLYRVARERQISVLLVEHDVELVMRLCSSVNVLDFGSLIAAGTPHEVRSNPAVRAAYLGEEIPSAQPAYHRNAPGKISKLTEAAVPSEPAAPRAPAEPSAPDGPPAMAVEEIAVRYGDALALSGISFAVGAGKTLAVLGANGAGKSSLARALSGLVPVSAGQIVFDGRRIDGWPAHRIRRAGIVHLPEGRGVFRSLSVLDNVKMAAASVVGRQARREAVETALELFPVLADRRRQTAGLLSGGEQQMLSLARAMATSPKLLIADEMSLGLAPMLVDLVFEGLDRARRAGVTVIMVEQYVHRALAFADDCLMLQRGDVAWHGPTASAGSQLLSNYLGAGVTAVDS